MKKSEILADRLKEVLLSGRWVARTNLKEQIESVSLQQALHQVEELNSIAVLTYHLNYYLGGLNHVFKGGELEIRDKFSFDMPPIESESDWTDLVNSFVSNSEEFVEHVEKMEDSQLEGPFVDPQYGTYQRNIEGVVEHSYYHLGQITMLKKMIIQ